MNFNLSRILRRLIPIILIGVIGNTLFVLYRSEEDLLSLLHRFQPALLLLAFALSLLPWLGHAMRTVIWSRFLSHPVSFKDSMRIAIAHDVGGAITPTVVGGTPIKLGLLIHKGVPAGSAGMIVVLQVLEDLIFIGTSLPLSLYFAGGLDNPAVHNLKGLLTDLGHHLWWIIPLLVGLIFLSRLIFKTQKEKIKQEIGISFWQRIKVTLRRTWTDFVQAGDLVRQRGKLRFLLTAAMMYVEWSCRFTIPIVLAFALGVEANAFQLFFLHWIVWLTSLVIPTPGAAGGAEATFYFLFLPFIPEGLIAVLISGWRLVGYYFMLLVGAILLQVMGVLQSD